MASALLPEFIRANSDWLRRRVGRENGASLPAQEEFAPVCFLLQKRLGELGAVGGSGSWHEGRPCR
jgi:hypothetical protein